MEDFVPFEIAQKLEEKGFTLPVLEIYGKFDSDGMFHSQLYCNYCETMDSEEIVAPTTSQVLKWLREEKEIDIVIEPIFFCDDNSNRIRNYNCVIFAPQLNKSKHCGYYDKWEESAIAGIEYTLENLI